MPELSPSPSFGSDGCPSSNLMCPHCYADLHAYSPVPFGEYCKFCSEYGDPDLDSNPEHHAADRRQRPETAVVESPGDTVPDAALVELYPPPPSRSAPPLALQILHTMQADKQAKQEQTKAAAKAERDRAKAAKGKTNANLKKAKADAPKADAQAGEATGSTTLVQADAGDTEGLLGYADPPARPAPFSKAGAKPQASPKAGGKGKGKDQGKDKGKGKGKGKDKGNGKGKDKGKAKPKAKPKAKTKSLLARVEHRVDKRLAAVPADAEPMAPVAKAARPAAPPETMATKGKRGRDLVEHEASISCWRVRLADGTSKGFSYKRGGSSYLKKLEAERWLADQVKNREPARVVDVDDSPCE